MTFGGAVSFSFAHFCAVTVLERRCVTVSGFPGRGRGPLRLRRTLLNTAPFHRTNCKSRRRSQRPRCGLPRSLGNEIAPHEVSECDRKETLPSRGLPCMLSFVARATALVCTDGWGLPCRRTRVASSWQAPGGPGLGRRSEEQWWTLRTGHTASQTPEDKAPLSAPE